MKRRVVHGGRGFTTKVELHVNVPHNACVVVSDRDAIRYAIDLIRELDDETVADYVCDHDWIIDEGECMFGCCVAPIKADPTSGRSP